MFPRDARPGGGWTRAFGSGIALGLALAVGCGTSSPSSAGNGSGSGSGSSGGGMAGSTSGSSGATSSSSGAASSSGSPSTDSGASGSCAVTASSVRVTPVDVGVNYVYSEIDSNGPNLGLAPLAISPIPGGGSRVAFMGSDSMVHIVALDSSDQLVAGSAFALPAFDFQDLYADSAGGVVLVSRAAVYGMGTGNCGDPSNLCGTPPTPPDPCFDMFMVRFDGAKETWAAKLTQSDATHPPYLTSKTDPNNLIYIWWYAHNGRIAFDGSNYAGYFGAAISVSQSGCVNIHQGDRMQIVNASGVVSTSGGFDWGCSHSGYERIVWDPTAKQFVTVCKNDAPTDNKSGRIAFAPATTTIDPVDLSYSDFGSVLNAGGGGYWLVTSDIRAGQTPNTDGLADIHLLHATTGPPDKDIMLASDSGLNDRAPHLAAYGTNRMLAAWETSTATGDLVPNDPDRKLYVQALDNTTGASQGTPVLVPGVVGSRYQDFRAYPDGSVAYVAPGSSASKINVVRVSACP
jgi:hypothetical protein